MGVALEWFESWFDSPYHGLLYRNRDEHEARQFIDNLFNYLQPEPSAKILDIACGDGRHAAYMKHFAQEVIGIDLSEQRIKRAQELAKDDLAFYKHDMRNVFRLNYFDYAFNFFTSFGYFQHHRDNVIAAEAFAKGLKPGGKLMIDYMNVDHVMQHLVAAESIVAGGIRFEIERSLSDGKIVKSIRFIDETGREHRYEEVVSAFTIADFESIFAGSGLRLTQTFGNYELAPFDPGRSPRLIMIFEK